MSATKHKHNNWALTALFAFGLVVMVLFSASNSVDTLGEEDASMTESKLRGSSNEPEEFEQNGDTTVEEVVENFGKEVAKETEPADYNPRYPYMSEFGKMNLSGDCAPYVQPPPRSSKPIKDDLIFAKAQACLKDSPFISGETLSKPILSDPSYKLPDDIEDHYFEMLKVTEALRHRQWHTYGGYSGPWIENVFISNFCCDRPLSAFGGLVPLFVQWTDIWILGGWFAEGHLKWPEFQLFLSKLRHDVIYVTVSQHDMGIVNSGAAIHPARNWNIFTFSSGGFGHVALPLISGHQKFVGFDTEAARNLFVFAGKFYGYGARHKMRDVFEKLQRSDSGFNYALYLGPKWKETMQTGLFNMAPRGFGRSSYRMSEVIQMGLIPVYVYDDEDWSPYKGTEAHMSNFGYVVRDVEFHAFAEKMFKAYQADSNKIHTELKAKFEVLKKFRDTHYTFPGVIRQMEFFFHNDPRSSLRCQRVPPRFN